MVAKIKPGCVPWIRLSTLKYVVLVQSHNKLKLYTVIPPLFPLGPEVALPIGTWTSHGR